MRIVLALTVLSMPLVAQSQPALYTCADGSRFSASFTPEAATLNALGRSFTLKHVPSGSGANYEADGLRLATKGKDASIECGGKPLFRDCHQADPTAPSIGVVKGTATYLDRRALPPGATLLVSVQDVSRADARALILGEITLPAKSAPIAFELPYKAESLHPRARIGISARIVLDSKLLYITDSFNGVINGYPNTVELTLKPAAQPR